MTANDMGVYLKQAMELEASVYTQDRALTDANRKLERYRPKQKKVYQKTVAVPKEPEIKQVNIAGNKRTLITAILIGIVFTVLGLIVAFKTELTLLSAVIIMIGLFMFFVAKGANTSLRNGKAQLVKNKELQNAYEKEMCEYPAKKEESDRIYQAELEEAERTYKEETQRYDVATKAANQLIEPYQETKDILQKLYDLDILFPKYRNLIAVSTMYEYFASGRVTTLEGPDGAYNLYESELRLNLIINKMDVIIRQLEDIKANQYALYNELKQTNEILTGIASDVSELVSATHEIADATKITAYCSYITAQNTEALKYITMING